MASAHTLAHTASSERLSCALATHGYVVLDGVDKSVLSQLLQCDVEAASLLTAAHVNDRPSLSVPPLRLSTRRHSACSKKLPLIGVGVNSVRGDCGIRRTQLHLVTDARALELVPWPARRPRLRKGVTNGASRLQELATSLLMRLHGGGAAMEHERARQAAVDGDPSVLDCFVYPNAHAEMANMCAHTDPGLLTLTLASATPGLQVHDQSTGEWVDVEAQCTPGVEIIVLGGEALEVASSGRYRAALHRVRHAATPRVSTVFELRIGHVPPPTERPPAARAAPMEPLLAASTSTAAGQSDERDPTAENEAVAAGRAYCVRFVRDRLADGTRTPADVLREFCVSDAAWPDEVARSGDVELLGGFLFEWVSTCREREAAEASFARAEYVVVTPAFADSTGRYVDVHFS